MFLTGSGTFEIINFIWHGLIRINVEFRNGIRESAFLGQHKLYGVRGLSNPIVLSSLILNSQYHVHYVTEEPSVDAMHFRYNYFTLLMMKQFSQ